MVNERKKILDKILLKLPASLEIYYVRFFLILYVIFIGYYLEVTNFLDRFKELIPVVQWLCGISLLTLSVARHSS
jgi:hypothetical protein